MRAAGEGKLCGEQGAVACAVSELMRSDAALTSHIPQFPFRFTLPSTQVSYQLGLKDHLVPMLHGVDCEPSYFIVGGLVFMPLTQPFLEMVFGGSGKRRWEGETGRGRGLVGAQCMCMWEQRAREGEQGVVCL